MGELGKLIKRATPPSGRTAIEQGAGSGVWFVDDVCPGTSPTRAQAEAVCLPHPEGGGRLMLRQVPAGYGAIEVEGGKVKQPEALIEGVAEIVRTK
jgi:hypothetical protein